MSKIFPFRMSDDLRAFLEERKTKTGAATLTGYMTMVLSGGMSELKKDTEQLSNTDDLDSEDIGESGLHSKRVQVLFTEDQYTQLIKEAKGLPLAAYLRGLVFKDMLIEENLEDEFTKRPEIHGLLSVHNTLEFLVKDLNSRGIKDCARLLEATRAELKVIIERYRED